jgi:hypothetical protein
MTNALEFLLGPQVHDARDRRVFGVVTATVRRLGDQGEYFLEYLSMGDGSQESAPARMMTPMAGADRGMHFFPEVGDEVVVAFELGDTNRPIILGAVWNNDSTAPGQAQESSRNDIRTIVSRSGHELTFDDSPGQEKVLVKTKGGHQILLDDLPMTGKVEITTAGGHQILLDDTPPGKVVIANSIGCKLTLDGAGGTATLESPLMLTLKSQIITIEGLSIVLKTTGSVSSSMVIIDGKPFGVHQHLTAPINPSGPVVP